MTTLTMTLPDETEPRKVLILLDEFHMLGRMETVANVFTLAGGYNCRVLAVVQGLTWIDDVYGKSKRNGILSVCAHKIFFAANDLETAAYVSEMCGDKTVQTVSITSNSSSRFGSSTKNTSLRTWPLITKDQVTRLPKKSEIILAEASYPIKCQKIAYNLGADAKIFSPRLMAAPTIPTLHIERYSIPRFDIPKSYNHQEDIPDPNQGDLLDRTDDQTPEDNSNKEDKNQANRKDGENKDTPEAGLLFDGDDDE